MHGLTHSKYQKRNKSTNLKINPYHSCGKGTRICKTCGFKPFELHNLAAKTLGYRVTTACLCYLFTFVPVRTES